MRHIKSEQRENLYSDDGIDNKNNKSLRVAHYLVSSSDSTLSGVPGGGGLVIFR